MSSSQFNKPVLSIVTQSLVKPSQPVVASVSSVPNSPMKNNDEPRLSPKSKLQFDLACKINKNKSRLDASMILHNIEINQKVLIDIIGEILATIKYPSSSTHTLSDNMTDYINEVMECIDVQTEIALIVAFIYIRRFLAAEVPPKLENFSPHSLFLTAVMIGMKWLASDDANDESYSMSGFAKVGKLYDADGKLLDKLLKQLEREFFTKINWELFITPEVFKKQLDDLNFYYLTKRNKTPYFLFPKERQFLVKSTISDEAFKPGHHIQLNKN